MGEFPECELSGLPVSRILTCLAWRGVSRRRTEVPKLRGPAILLRHLQSYEIPTRESRRCPLASGPFARFPLILSSFITAPHIHSERLFKIPGPFRRAGPARLDNKACRFETFQLSASS